MTGDTVRVLIVDDHMIVRQGLKLIFETEDDIDVIGEAENGRIGVEMVAELEPEQSVRLQEVGLGSGRSIGCGLFIPHRGIKPVNDDKD